MRQVHWFGLLVLFQFLPLANAQTMKVKESLNSIRDKAIEFVGTKRLDGKNAITFDTKFPLPNDPIKVDASWSIQGCNQGRIRLALRVDDKKIEMTVVVNQDEVWAIGPDGKIDNPRKSEAGAVKSLIRAIRFAQRPDYLSKTQFMLSLLPNEKVGKDESVGIAIAEKDHDTINLYFDVRTGRPLKAAVSVSMASKEGPEELALVFMNYGETFETTKKGKEKLTIKSFGKVIVYLEGRKLFEVPVTNIRQREKLDPGLFTRPKKRSESPEVKKDKTPPSW
ncbi:MAG: hypothetical protein ACFCD0_19360 [Gemmataceae bacterium]